MLRSLALSLCAAASVFAAEPVVKTVPWVPSDRAIPHDTFAYKSITLKGTSSLQGPNIRATWDFGDGSAPVSFIVENAYDVSTTHVYYGSPGDNFTARLTVTDTTTGESGSAVYLLSMREKTLHTEVNVAIDEGLWYLHRSMNRLNAGDTPAGNWNGDCRACDLNGATNAWNILAFERQGHLESGDSSDPYTETVARGLRTLLSTGGTPGQVWIDAISAANSPRTVATVGPEGIIGATYADIIQRFVESSNGQLSASSTSREEEIQTLLATLADSAGTPAVATQSLVRRQDRMGYWYGRGTASNPALETPQALLSMVKTPERAAGANSVVKISSQVNVTNTGWLFSRATNTYNGNLTVTNTSGSPIPGPVTVGILNLTSGVTLTNGNGMFNGAPYVTVSGGPINAGASATVQLRFTNPSNAIINFNRITYSGAFPPAALSISCPASSGTLNTSYTSAFDANGGVQSYTYSFTGSLPSGLNLNPATGAVTGTPDTVQNATFTAIVTDSAGPITQTANLSCNINITNGANATPTANPQTTGTNEDQPVTITLAGSDPENANLSFSIVSGPSAGSLGAIVPINATSASVQYTPALNGNGSASFTFKVNDGTQDSSPATVTINIAAVNDAPGFTKGPDQNIAQNAGPQTVNNWATAVSPGGGADEAGQTLTFNITGNTNPGLFSVAPSIASNGTLTYTPASGQSGSATITVTLSDNGGTANGGVNTSAQQTFAINIALVNQPPSFTKGPDQSVNEDSGPQTVNPWATAISPGPASESGQTVSFNITGNTNPSLFSAGPAVSSTGVLTYTPAANANGSATITLVAQDNGGTANGGNDTSASQSFVITVNPVNDVPSFTKGPDQTVNEDAGPQTVNPWATAISSGPANESGQTVSFSISGNTNAALFSAGPAVSPTGVLTYTPAANTSGTATITLSVADNGGTANGGVDTSSTQTFVITVNNVNDAPSFTKGADQTVNEDAGPQTVNPWATAVSAGPPSESGQTLTFNVTGNTNPGLFSAGPAISSTGVLTYTPAANANGSATITITLQDNGGTANGGVDTSPSQQFVINVTAVNDAPAFTKGADQTVLEDAGAQTVGGWATAMSSGPADESAQTLSFSITDNTNTALFSAGPTVANDGTLTYTPAPNANGSASITVRLTDSGSNTAPNVNFSQQTFVITVTAVNDVPSFTPGGTQTVNEDAGAQSVAWATAISKGPANESGQTINFIVSNNNNALFSVQPAISATGQLSYTPASNKHGSATVSVQVHDDGGTANGGVDTSTPPVTFNITVNPVNDPPTAQVQSYNAQAHMMISVPQASGLLVGASDAADITGNPSWTPTFTVGAINGVGPVSGTITTTVAGVGTIVANATTGAFTFDPAPGVSGTVSTTYTVCDNGEPAPGVCSSSSNLTFVIAGPVIWFVNPAGGAGTGTLGNPFNTLSAAATAMGTNTNHRIFVYSGTASGNLALTGAATQAAAQWLVGQGTVAPGTSFDTFMGISPPITTVLARPSLNGTNPVLQGTITIGATNSSNNLIRGVTIQPTSGKGLVASSSGTGFVVGAASFPATSSDVAISTTSSAAVDLAGGGSGNFIFRSVSTNGGANGILVNNFNASTGSFMVAGTGTAGTGGTIQNTTTRGASFITTRNVTLKSMNFTNAATSDFPAAPTGLSLGVNTADNAALHLQVVFNATLDGLVVNGSAEHGINGHNVTDFVLQNSSFTNVGNAADEDGIHFFNMLGTCSITNTTFTSSGDDNINIQNNTNLTIPSGMTAVTNLTITGGSANTGVLGSGYLMGIRGTSNTTVTIDGVTANNNFSGGIVIDTFDTATSVVEIKNSTSTNNNDGISMSSNNGSTKFDIHDNVSFAGNDFGRINILKAAFSTTGTLQGKIRNNPINVSDGQAADGISIFQAGDGVLTVAITGNTITYRGTQRPILIQGGQDGSGQLNATVTGNNIDVQLDGTGNAVTGILAQVAVASPSGDSTNLCADIGGSTAVLKNTFTHSLGNNMGGGDIRVRQRFVTTVTLPGYSGSNNDNAAVVTYLGGRNTLVNSPTATATNEIGVTVGAGGFVGGASCTQPVFP
ncbi:MAG: Ig-like domain-containing protein [Bryobacteraceae bacterium]